MTSPTRNAFAGMTFPSARARSGSDNAAESCCSCSTSAKAHAIHHVESVALDDLAFGLGTQALTRGFIGCAAKGQDGNAHLGFGGVERYRPAHNLEGLLGFVAWSSTATDADLVGAALHGTRLLNSTVGAEMRSNVASLMRSDSTRV